jgi:TIR domain
MRLEEISADTPVVFVCYADEDRDWLKEGEWDSLIPAISRSLKRNEGALVWWDTAQIGGGDEWEQKIRQAIGRACVAICLVSRNLMDSDFIRAVELPLIESRKTEGKLSVIPVLVGACMFDKIELFRAQQVLHGRPPVPLIKVRNNRAEFEDAREAIIEAVSEKVCEWKSVRSSERIRIGTDPDPRSLVAWPTAEAGTPSPSPMRPTGTPVSSQPFANVGSVPSHARTSPPPNTVKPWFEGSTLKQAIQQVARVIKEGSSDQSISDMAAITALLQHIAKLHREGGEALFDLQTGQPYRLFPQQADGSPMQVDGNAFTAFWLLHNSPESIRRCQQSMKRIVGSPFFDQFCKSGLFDFKSPDDHMRVALSIARTYGLGGEVQADVGLPRRKTVKIGTKAP